jgi:hypothetical protein
LVALNREISCFCGAVPVVAVGLNLQELSIKTRSHPSKIQLVFHVGGILCWSTRIEAMRRTVTPKKAVAVEVRTVRNVLSSLLACHVCWGSLTCFRATDVSVLQQTGYPWFFVGFEFRLRSTCSRRKQRRSTHPPKHVVPCGPGLSTNHLIVQPAR